MSEHFCLVVAQDSIGRYGKTTARIRFPARMSKTSGTRTVRVRWQPEGSAIKAGANCRIPDSDEAEQFLLDRVFFTSPSHKRRFVTSGGSRTMGSLLALADTTAQGLPGVYVYADYNYGQWYHWGAGRSVEDEGPQSMDPWEDWQPVYDEPGDPCTDNGYSGELFDSEPLVDQPAEACKKYYNTTLCIDLWIKQCEVAMMKGDCRNADPNAPPEASRAQITLPTSFAFHHDDRPRLYISPSCLSVAGAVPHCEAPLDSVWNKVNITYFGPSGMTDSIRVDFSLTNSLAVSWGIRYGPSIDGSVVLIPTLAWPEVVWSARIDRDAFPSLAIVKSEYNQNTLLVTRDEQGVEALIDRLNLRDKGLVCGVNHY